MIASVVSKAEVAMEEMNVICQTVLCFPSFSDFFAVWIQNTVQYKIYEVKLQIQNDLFWKSYNKIMTIDIVL